MQLKCVGPKLVPFLKTVAIFFVLFGVDSVDNSIFFCIIKCLPIVSLMLFVVLHGMNFTEYYRYSRRILIGLIFSALGDIALVWDGYFEVGIGMFAIAQISYARAFGWKPFNPYAGAVCTVLASGFYLFLQPGLEGKLLYLTPFYMFLISTMLWRAVARVQLFDDLWTWTKLCGFVGSILFVISDLTIAIDRFRMPVPFAHQIIMLTYYAAQLLIALTVVDSQVDEIFAMS